MTKEESEEEVAVWPTVITTGHDFSEEGKGLSKFISTPKPIKMTEFTNIIYSGKLEESDNDDDESERGKINLSDDKDLKSCENFQLGKDFIFPRKNEYRIIQSELPAGMDKRAGLHRTLTVDIIIVIEGTVVCHLDNGEQKTLGKGSTLIQRQTVHSWSNPNLTQPAKFIGFILPSTKLKGVSEESQLIDQ